MAAEINREQVIKTLNSILEAELAGVVRYTHYSLMIFGHARIPIINWMRTQATESLTHACAAGEHITSLGGHPSLRIGSLLETEKHDIDSILREALEHESFRLKHYRQLLEQVTGKRVYLEQNKSLEVKLHKKIAAGQNLYHLAEQGGKSSSFLRSPLMSQAYAQASVDDRRWVMIYQDKKNTGAAETVIPEKTQTPLTANEVKDGQFKLRLNLKTSPELAKYKNTRWAFAGKKNKYDPSSEKNKWVLNEQWDRRSA